MPLETLEAGAIDAVMPLMRAVVERGEALVLKVHEQGFGSEDTPDVTRASPYMQDLSRHLSHSRYSTFSRFRFALLTWMSEFVAQVHLPCWRKMGKPGLSTRREMHPTPIVESGVVIAVCTCSIITCVILFFNVISN